MGKHIFPGSLRSAWIVPRCHLAKFAAFAARPDSREHIGTVLGQRQLHVGEVCQVRCCCVLGYASEKLNRWYSMLLYI